jgi:hypothetical protein
MIVVCVPRHPQGPMTIRKRPERIPTQPEIEVEIEINVNAVDVTGASSLPPRVSNVRPRKYVPSERSEKNARSVSEQSRRGDKGRDEARSLESDVVGAHLDSVARAHFPEGPRLREKSQDESPHEHEDAEDRRSTAPPPKSVKNIEARNARSRLVANPIVITEEVTYNRKKDWRVDED